jgi:hypothetical protein
MLAIEAAGLPELIDAMFGGQNEQIDPEQPSELDWMF